MNQFKGYHRALGLIERFQHQGKNFMKDRLDPQIYIDRMKFFLNILDNPQNAYKVIHITGTAGKGTVATMLQKSLVASGKRTGLYTLPYCVAAIENIQVYHRYISPAAFTVIVEHLREALSKARHSSLGVPSYFEIMTAIAFLYFKDRKCEWVVLEAGLGGRYDATNVIDSPAVTAITSLGYDHTEILGHTLQKIARDKGGIIKPGSHFFTTVSDQRLCTIFEKICTQQSAVFTSVQGSNNELVQRIGAFLKLPKSAIDRGIARTQLPCHSEIIDKCPRIILDGAHNELKINYLFDHLKEIPRNQRIIIFGVADDKNKKAILKRIAKEANHIIFTKFNLTGFPGRHCADSSELVRIARSFNRDLSLITARTPREALEKARAIATSTSTIIATGSFYLTGELRKQWYPEEWILKHRSSF